MKNRLRTLFAFMACAVALSGCNGSGKSSDLTSSTSSSSETEVMNPEDFSFPDIQATTTKLVTYPGPDIMDSSSKVSIAVNDNPLFVYETRVNHMRSFTFTYSQQTNPVAIFDFEGHVEVEIDVHDVEAVSSVKISPEAYAVNAKISGTTIKFGLDYSANYIIEYNGDADNVIHLFANPLETDPIDPNNIPANVTYIGPGAYDADAIPLKSNSTIYLAGGAYVFGQIRAEGVNNVKIRGRGILDGQIYDRMSENQFTLPIELRNSTNIEIDDIAILDPAGWAITLYFCDQVTVSNIKIITARANGDGISVQSSSNVLVKGGFVRTWDDSLVVKNVDRGTTKNIHFDNVVVWTDLAQSMEVGYETYGPSMDEITFSNITIVHNFHKPAMSIHNCDDANITNVTYENITLEDGQMLGDVRDDGEDDYLIDITIAYNVEWTKSAGTRGSINGVTFKNIKVLNMADTIISRINGESEASMVRNVSFENINIAGKTVEKASDLKLVTNTYTSGFTFTKGETVRGAIINLPYTLALADNNVVVDNITGIKQEGLIVPEFAWLKGGLSYAGVPASGDFSAKATHGSGTLAVTPDDDGSGNFEQSGHEAAAILNSSAEATWISGEWKDEKDEFAALTIEFNAIKYVGQVRIYGSSDNIFSYEYSMQIWGKKLKSDGSVSDKYVRILPTRDYMMTPQNGNAIDVVITAQQYAGIQIRFYRTEGFLKAPHIEVSKVDFFAPSLTFAKPIVDSTPYEDVYDVSKINDGNTEGTSYYESESLPAYVVIDMGDVYNISYIVLSLPPSLLWDPRTQNIEIQTSADNVAYDATKTSFTTLFAATDYLFDPVSGNMVALPLDNPVSARFIKIIISSNSAVGGYGAQLSEVSVYGE